MPANRLYGSDVVRVPVREPQSGRVRGRARFTTGATCPVEVQGADLDSARPTPAARVGDRLVLAGEARADACRQTSPVYIEAEPHSEIVFERRW
jgi:hypothetical protein